VTSRTWFRVHSFTGVVTGLLLFVICWSGTFAVLAREIDWLATPAARVDVQTERASWGEWRAAAQRAYPDAEIQLLEAPLYPAAAARVLINRPDQDALWVYINPYTAEVTGTHSYFTAQRFFRSFHMNLFLPQAAGLPIGLYVVTAFGLCMLTSVFAALMFYRRWWRRFFRWPRGRGRVFWSQVHKTAGLWSIWFMIVIGVTGAWYLYEVLQPGPVNYVGPPPSGAVAPPTPASDPETSLLPLDQLLAEARAAWPEFEVRTVGFGWYSRSAETLYLEGQAGFPLVRDRANQLHLDPRTGEVLWRNAAGGLPNYWIWSNMADPLHFGDFAGLWSKAVWFAFGLALSGLILTGTWLHAHRLAREAADRTRHRWPGTAAAVVVSLAVFAASIPFGVTEARNYGPVVDGVQRFPDLAPGVAAIIFGWTALTLAILGAWVALLWRPALILPPGPGRNNTDGRRQKYP
jgi:uncharacterized iron-regulated membrane protein